MFKSITWGQYLLVIVALLALYYAYVGLVYYRAELLALLKGKKLAAPAATPAPSPALGSLVGKGGGAGPLLAKAAVALPAPPPELAGPAPAAPDESTDELTDEALQEGPDDAADQLPTADQDGEPEQPATVELSEIDTPALDLPSVKEDGTNQNENEILPKPNDEKVISKNETDVPNSLPGTESGLETASESFEPDFTIGVAQLSDYFARAAEGDLSPENLVEQEPALENTDLLVAFFMSSSKAAQQLTTRLYDGVDEPAND